jgi:hypothetical protein
MAEETKILGMTETELDKVIKDILERKDHNSPGGDGSYEAFFAAWDEGKKFLQRLCMKGETSKRD